MLWSEVFEAITETTPSLTSADLAAASFAALRDALAEAARRPKLDFEDMMEAA